MTIERIPQAINLENVNLRFLTLEEARTLPRETLRNYRWWWLQQIKDNHDRIPYVTPDGIIQTNGVKYSHADGSVRPVLECDGFGDLQKGDKFQVNGAVFEIISETAALAEVGIGEHPYSWGTGVVSRDNFMKYWFHQLQTGQKPLLPGYTLRLQNRGSLTVYKEGRFTDLYEALQAYGTEVESWKKNIFSPNESVRYKNRNVSVVLYEDGIDSELVWVLSQEVVK